MVSVIAFIALAAAACLIYVRGQGLVYIGRTAAGLTTVHDDVHVMGERIRVLEVDGTYQSGTYLDHRWADLVFPYHCLFEHLFDAWPIGSSPHAIAVLGGGGYAIPKHLVVNHPEVERIDVVEIDPLIERIARKHFFVDRLEAQYRAETSGRLQLHVNDARTWLESCDTHFDAIINDCFFGIAPEESLITDDAAQLIADHLTPAGVYLTNVVSALRGPNAEVLHATMSSLRSSFRFLWVYPCSAYDPTSRDNNVVIASNVHHEFSGAWEWPDDDEEEQ